MRSAPDQIKHDLHLELRTRYKEFFESQLAIHLLKHPEYFPAVKKISNTIKNLITTHKNKILEVIRDNPKIIMELSEPYFGACFDNKQTIAVDTAYEKMITILNDNNPDLSSIMQIHCIFIHRIYDHIEPNKDKANFCSTLLPTSLFNQANRSRENKENVQATLQLGIARHPVFSKMLEKHNKKHIRALDKYSPNNHSAFSQSAMSKAIPVVCGPSGHTASLMLGAKLYGELTPSELKEYALASFAFLTAGGHHSFHEVFIIANLLGVAYEADDYSFSIPESISATNSYKQMQKLFSEFL